MDVLRKSVWLLLACVTANVLAQEPYPSRPTRILVGFQRGGSVDSPRAHRDASRSLLWHKVLVENKLGASGIIAATEVARSAPDGYTLSWRSRLVRLAPNMQPTLPFDR